MAKVTAPLFSFSASGTIAEALTFSSWRGIDYVRERVIPNNPQTAAQTAVRNVFANLQTIFTFMNTLARAPWADRVAGLPLTERNQHESSSLAILVGDANMADYVFSPTTNAPFLPLNVIVVAGVGDLTVTADAPTVPTGWVVDAMVVRALADRNPETGAFNQAQLHAAAEDVAAPFSVVLTPLFTGEAYRVGVWMRMTSPEGDTRFSLAALDTGTPV